MSGWEQFGLALMAALFLLFLVVLTSPWQWYVFRSRKSSHDCTQESSRGKSCGCGGPR